MTDPSAVGEATLEIIAPDRERRSVRSSQIPFLIGRGSGNQLQLSDGRISSMIGLVGTTSKTVASAAEPTCTARRLLRNL